MMKLRGFFLALGFFWLTVSPLTAQQPKRITVAPGDTLSLRLRTGGSVRVQVWTQNVVEVSVTGVESCGDCDFRIEPTGEGVEISSDYPRRSRNHSSSLTFDVQVPEHFNIELDSMGGGLEVIGLDGTIRGKTMGGGLHFEQLRGEVHLTTMGGDVVLRDSEVDGQITTMGGKVLFERVRGDVRGKSMGGDVIYRNVENTRNSDESVGEEVQIETMGGSIQVEEAPYGARVRTMGGDIEIGSVREFVRATTYGGDIRVDSAEGEIELKTYSGDIEVNITGEVGEIDLSSLQGRVVLELPSSFSGSIEVELSYTRNSRRNYEIQSDFPLEMEEDEDWDYSHGSPRRSRYGSLTIGTGGSRVRIRTVNGDVILRKK